LAVGEADGDGEDEAVALDDGEGLGDCDTL
jgi:hypothetical protein